MATIQLPRVSDNRLLHIFINETLNQRESFGLSDQAKVNIRIASNSFSITSQSFNDDGSLESNLLERIRAGEESSTAIALIQIQDPATSCNIYYQRPETGLIDKFVTPNEAVTEELLDLIYHLEKQLLKGLVQRTSDNTTDDVFSAHHQVLTKLEGLNASLIDKQQEHLRRIELDKQTFIDTLSSDFSDKKAGLEADYRERLESLETQYTQRNDELDQRQQLIEDADNTTARRKTTTDMLEDVKEKARRFNFSPSVLKYNYISILLSLLLIVAGAFNAYSAINEISVTQGTNISTQANIDVAKLLDLPKGNDVKVSSQASSETNAVYTWALYIRAFLGSALAISSTIYLIKWFNSWANRIAQQELDNQQFVRDLNRAHLAVEMSLEWNEKKDGDIPERLLNSLTEGLFQDKSQPQQDLAHPADQLASALVRSADKIKLPVGSGELEIAGNKVAKAKTNKNRN
ncbi:hypothetical protein OTK49_05785 [Vibrio coralliirubri]|uniref:hypothetical protein n=1 Tax=Vibrio coralliirubri TaxID=1516159 RepID=UPI0022833663|nr:hypothetical protein [Vibrio coralliirubri]MCY9862039.1 hypothetical protein [Vibrio coralliirubri]